MEQDAQFSSDVRVAKQCIENYVAESQKMVALFNRLDQGMATAEEANAFIQNFRETGNRMINAINALSQRVDHIDGAECKEQCGSDA